MANLNVTVEDGNNINVEVTPTPRQTIVLDRGVAGVGIESVSIIFQDPTYYLEFTYTNGTTELVALPAIATGVVSFNTRIGIVTLTSLDVTTALGYTPPTPTGTGATGTWAISVSGNAATATNGVVTTGSYSDPAWITALAGAKIVGDIAGNAGTVTNGVYTTDVGTVTNTMLAGSIANNKLVNSAITINGTSTSLGGSVSVGTVTSVSGTAPIASTGGTTPAISISQSGTSTDGYLSSIDWNTFNSKTTNTGTVTSVAATAGTGISVSGSPITTSGTLTITNTAPDQVVSLTGAGTTSVTGTYPNFTITSDDQFDGTVTSVAASAGTGISVSGSPITSSGTITITNTAPDQVVSLTGAGTTAITGTYPNFTITSDDQFDGTVTSVSGTGSVNGISLSGTVTSSGNLTLGGTLSNVSLTTQVTGTLPIANGGTNATTAPDARTSLGLGTSAVLNAAVALGTATLDAGGTVPLSQIPASIQGGLIYQGTWNASTNTPTLTSSVGTKGYYYAVSVAGSTNLNGITDWNIGDLAVYNGTVWEQIDNTDAVTSVNGYTGSVVLTTTDVAEGTNQYFTQSRARTSISAGTGISYDNTSGIVTNAAPDQTVSLTGTGTTSITGTYPNFTITANDEFDGTVTSVAATAGTGISVTGSPITSSGTLTITNTAPDQVVSLTGAGTTSISGTYPNFTITSNDEFDGNVTGAASSTDNAIVRFDGTTGKVIQNSTVTIDDNGNASNVNAVSFDTTPATLPTTEGSMYWDADKGAVAFVMQGGDVVQEIGESQYLYIQASASITKGQVVMFTGAIGGSGIPTGAPATGVTDGTYIMGIAAEDITSGTSGFVQTFGILKPINTTGFATGTIIWYDPTVTGGFTSTKPVAPNIKVQLAAVTAGNSSGGAILIRVTAGTELGGTDSNAQITTPTNGQLITYDGTGGYWKNTELTAGTAINVSKSSAGVLTVANTAPDQVVSITGGGTTTVTGTYPNFTVSSDDQFDGTVTSVGGTGTVNGITLTGTVTSSGNLTLGGTLSGVDLTTQVTGTLPVANGGSGATTLTGYLKGTGTSAFTGSSTIPSTDITGLGTMSTQNANGVVVTGGTIDGTTIGGSTAAAGTFTTLTTSSTVTHNGGTANGVAYLNGSKVLTTGSALTFDGTNFAVGSGVTGGYKLTSYTSSGNNGISIENGGNTGSDFAVLDFRQAATQRAVFYTNSGNLTSNVLSGANIFQIGSAEQMRLTSTGLGIGTSSPDRKLSIYTTDSGGKMALFSNGNTNTNLYLSSDPTSGGGVINVSNNAASAALPLIFQGNGTERMRLDSSGNLGLGVTPSAWNAGKALQVNGTAVWNDGSSSTYWMNNAYYNGGFKYFGTSGASSYAMRTDGAHQWFTAPSGTAGDAISFTQAMTLDASGNLGLGTSSPSSYGKFVIASTSAAATLLSGVDTGNTYFQFYGATSRLGYFGYGDLSQNLYFFNDRNAGMFFGTNAAERMRIHASGGVSIGNTTDSGAASLNVSGSISGGYVALANGTTAMGFGADNVVRVTPTATATFTSTVPAAGAICVLSILTSGASSYTITFGTGFKSTGTLATGTTTARYFQITFVSDGTNLLEMSRTVAIA